MDPVWIERLGVASRWIFLALVGGLLAALLARRLPRSRAAPRRRDTALRSPLWEYVCNFAPGDTDEAPAGAYDDALPSAGARALLDEVSRVMAAASHVGHVTRQSFLDDLRSTIRLEEGLRRHANGDRTADLRFAETRRWALAERFHTLVEDPPHELVRRIRGESLEERVAIPAGSEER